MSNGTAKTHILVLPESSHCPTRTITDCEWKLKTFLERDAYAPYDVAHAQKPPAGDRLEARHRIAINDAMRARSSIKAWEPFLEHPIPELSQVSRNLCLVHGDATEVEVASAAVAEVVARIGSVRGLTDMAATKMLYLLRPCFVAISDSYVRAGLGLHDGTPPGPGPSRAAFVRDRFIRVLKAMRALGQANVSALRHLEAYVADLDTVKIADDCQESTRRWRGCILPARLSPVRILDILLWTDGAIRGPVPDPKWRIWAHGREGK